MGGGVADPTLVQTFVHGIPRAIQWLEQDLDVELQRPQSAESAQQKQFIPCFDHKTRMWRGLTRKPLEDACTAQIELLGIRLLPRHELIDLVEDSNGRIIGAVLYDRANERLVPLAAKATIMLRAARVACSSAASLPPTCLAPRRPSHWRTAHRLLI